MLWNRAVVWWLWILALYLICLYACFRWAGVMHGGAGGSPGPGSN